MKKLLVAAIAVAAFCGAPALAADMPVKAPVYKAAAPYDPWTGFYMGGSVGARMSDVDWRTVDFPGAGPATTVDNPAHLNSTSVRIGGYTGYNWKIAPAWLAGLEADIAWGDNKKTHTPFPGTIAVGTTGNDFVTAKLGWDGSIRGRLGVLVNPNWLVYATGGVAWQQIKTSATCGAPGPSYCSRLAFFNESSSTTKAGWTVGGGAEAALSNNWFGRVEYRYADFGHVTNTLPPAPDSGFNASVNVKTHTALLGLAYKY
jgi:outer membrane immunogenic protein